MRFRLVLAAADIGAESINLLVLATVAFGIGDGPLAWVGHDGEKWSFTTEQHGHMNQCDAAVSDRGRWLAIGLLDAFIARSVRLFPVCFDLRNRDLASRSKAASH